MDIIEKVVLIPIRMKGKAHEVLSIVEETMRVWEEDGRLIESGLGIRSKAAWAGFTDYFRAGVKRLSGTV